MSNSSYSEPTGDDLYTISFESLQMLTNEVLLAPQPDLWLKYFKYLFAGTNVTIDPSTDLLYVTDVDLEYISRIVPYVFNTPGIHVELYLWWSSVYAMIINTSTSIVSYIRKNLEIFGTNPSYVARSR